jgi:hypothetical protein
MKIAIKDPKNLDAPFYAIVDDEEYEQISNYRWHIAWRGNNIYARTSVDKTTGKFSAANKGTSLIYMHKMITGFNKTDHRNNIGLDNRRENLRNSTTAQNNRNSRPRGGTSQYKGVYFEKRRNHWVASVRFNGGNHYLGSFNSEIEAAKAYDKFADENYEEFSKKNF